MEFKHILKVNTFYLPLCLITTVILHINNTSLMCPLYLSHPLMRIPFVMRIEKLHYDLTVCFEED